MGIYTIDAFYKIDITYEYNINKVNINIKI